MTKSLLLLLFLFPVLAFSQGSTNDYLLSQKPASGPLVVRPVTPAVGKLLGWPASINTPAAITLGTSLSITGTTLNAIPAWGDLTGIPAAVTNLSGTNTGDNAVNSNYSGLVTNATHTGDATGATALTLATVNSNVGSFGSATEAPAVTVNAKGLVTAVTTNTITPAVGSITGLGTGIATALAINSGTAGAPVLLNAALGTPSSGVVTNLTGTASININGTVGATTPNTGAFSSVVINGATLTAEVPNFATTASTTNYLGVKTTGTGANIAAGMMMENSTSQALLFKAGTGYGTYKTITSNDLGFYNNNIGGNISILNDYTSGNVNFAAGGSSTAHLTIASTGVVNVANLTTNGVVTATSGNGTLTTVAPGTNGNVLTSNGTSWTSAAPAGGGLTIGTTAITGGTSGRLLTSGTTVGELTLGTGVSTFLGTPSLANFNTALSDADVATTGANTYTGLQQFSGTTHAGLRLNNLTTAERDALTGAAGMAIWNTTDGRLQLHNGSAWTSGMVRLSGDTMTGALTITQGTANTGILTSTGYSLTGSNATTMVDLAGTWNTTGTPTAIKLNITNTASNSASSLIDVQSGGTSRFKVLATGGTTLGGGASSPLSIVSSTGTVTFTATGDGSLLQDKSVILPATGYVRFGFVGSNDPIITGASSSLTISQITSFQLGANTATNGATATAQTIKGPNATGTTSTGGSLTLAGGTGTSAGGAVIITTAATTTQTERARFSSAGVTIGASGTAIASVISNTATLDFPSTSSHHSSDLTLTVTGAAVGDVVAIGIPNGSVGTTGVFFGWVSAADTVTIRYTNTHNGGAVDPASGTFRATVIKH